MGEQFSEVVVDKSVPSLQKRMPLSVVSRDDDVYDRSYVSTTRATYKLKRQSPYGSIFSRLSFSGRESILERIRSHATIMTFRSSMSRTSHQYSLSTRILEIGNFVLFCMAFGVGLGNLWRFPYVAYKHSGGNFLLAYIVLAALVGIPLFFMEFALGQFSNFGPVKSWDFCPTLRGVGISMVALSLIVAIPYSVTIALSLHYLVFSFSSDLPLLACHKNETLNACTESMQGPQCERKCYSTLSDITNVNLTLRNLAARRRIEAAEQYFHWCVFDSGGGGGSREGARKHWALLVCFLCGWFLVWLIIFKGLRSAAKIVYVTSIVPYATLLFLLIACLRTKGSIDGIKFFFTPDMDTFFSPVLWEDAAVQVFYSFTVTLGGIITLASLNDVATDCLKYTFILTFANVATSILAGSVVFCCLGVIARIANLPVGDFRFQGPELIFVVYPEAVKELAARNFWSILIFTTLVFVGLNNQISLMTTASSAFLDWIPSLSKHQWLLPALTCTVCCLLSMPIVLLRGSQLYAIVDKYAATSNGFIIAAIECSALTWIYGGFRFLADIEMMIGKNYYFGISWSTWRWWWIVCWSIFIPIAMVTIGIFDFYTARTELTCYSHGVSAFVWVLRSTALLIIFITLIVYIARGEGELKERFRNGSKPTSAFLESLSVHTVPSVRYAPSAAGGSTSTNRKDAKKTENIFKSAFGDDSSSVSS